MEKKHSIVSKRVLLLLCALLAFAGPGYAKREEKRVAGKTYVYDYDKKSVYNKSFANVNQDYAREGYSAQKNSLTADAFRKALGRKRIGELKQQAVIMSFVCKADGSIESVKFIFPRGIFLTTEEVMALEKEILGSRIPLTVEPGINRVGFYQVIRFRDL